MIPLGRLGRSDDVANVVAVPASAESSFVSGALIDIDGGMTPGVDIIGRRTGPVWAHSGSAAAPAARWGARADARSPARTRVQCCEPGPRVASGADDITR